MVGEIREELWGKRVEGGYDQNTLFTHMKLSRFK